MLVAIVDTGGISKAADQLNIAKSAVSRRLAALERRLGVTLFNRTTRKSSLSQAGHLYYQRARTIIDDVSALENEVGCADATLDGRLKIAMPLSFGLLHLSAAIDQFAKQYDQLDLQLDLSDNYIDLVEGGYDLAIRIGELADSGMQAKALAPIHFVLCASPEYLDRREPIDCPSDLSQHRMLQYGRHHHNNRIHLRSPTGKALKLSIDSKIHSNNGDMLKQLAIAGHGVVLIPSFLVYDALAQGSLRRILEDHPIRHSQVHAIYPGRKFLSRRSRVFIDFLAEYFGKTPHWDNGLFER